MGTDDIKMGEGLIARAARAPRTYTVEALVAEGFPLSTIRWYRRIGVLPKAEGGRGTNAFYTDVHIAILREIKEAKDDRRSLKDLKEWADYRFPEQKRQALGAELKAARTHEKEETRG